ncbi:unnamed protein product [Prunus brigantina]
MKGICKVRTQAPHNHFTIMALSTKDSLVKLFGIIARLGKFLSSSPSIRIVGMSLIYYRISQYKKSFEKKKKKALSQVSNPLWPHRF